MDIHSYRTKLLAGKHLSTAEAKNVFSFFLSGEATDVQIASLLTLLKQKGENINEIYGFVQGMRENMTTIKSKGLVIDTCGTGGDASNSFNISTAVAFVVAGAGVQVAKHGNKAASSKCGSADVLEALGVNIMLKPREAEEVLQKSGIVFLYAPIYHAALKPLVLVRKQLGFPTIFNYLGPFCNPARAKRQMIGVPDKAVAAQLAKMASQLEYDHLMIVSNENGLDEVGLDSVTHAWIIEGMKTQKITIDPQKNGYKKHSAGSMQGGNAEENALILKSILSGEISARRDIVVLNAACALRVAGVVQSIPEGIAVASQSIDSGAALESLDKLVFITNTYA